jgi:hypothetical protein
MQTKRLVAQTDPPLLIAFWRARTAILPIVKVVLLNAIVFGGFGGLVSIAGLPCFLMHHFEAHKYGKRLHLVSNICVPLLSTGKETTLRPLYANTDELAESLATHRARSVVAHHCPQIMRFLIDADVYCGLPLIEIMYHARVEER